MRLKEFLAEDDADVEEMDAKIVKYGMIAIPDSGILDFEAFEDVRVYFDKKKFESEVNERFQMWADEEDVEGLTLVQMEKHELWDDFVEHHWIIDRF